MDNGGHYDDYTGHGIDKVEDSGNVDFGDGANHRIYDYEHNPRRNSNNNQESGKERDALDAGERNQQSDKDGSSRGDATWTNRTGQTAKMVAASISGNAFTFARNVRKNGGLINTAKVVGPAGMILIILAMCMSVFFSSQSAMLAGVVSNLQSAFDPVEIAAKVRSRILIKGIMSGTNTKGGVWSKFSDYMKVKLSQAGVDVRGEGDKDSLYFKNEVGEEVKVDADNLDSAVATNTKIATDLDAGMKTVGSSVPVAYGETGTKVYKGRVGATRNELNQEDNNGKDFDETKEKVDTNSQEALDKSTHKMSGDVESGRTEERDAVDDDGNTLLDDNNKPIKEDYLESGRTHTDIDSPDDVEVKVSDMVEEEVGKGMDFSIVGTLVNGGCQLYTVATTINSMIKNMEMAQVAVMALRFLEAVQRMQAGDGGFDLVFDVFAQYAAKIEKKVLKFGEGEEVEVEGSMMSSSPMAAVFGGSKLTSEDPIVKSFITSPSQFRRIMSTIDGGTGYKACTGARIAAGVVDAVGDAVTLGGTKLLGLLAGVALGTSISLIVGAVVDVLVPKAVNAMTRDFSSFMMGPESSAVLMWGSEIIMGELARHVAMQPATPETLLAYNLAKQEVIAEQARIDRYTLSPFDVSSEHTFMGSLVRSFGKLSFSTQSIMGKVAMLMSTAGKSLISLTPASHAYSLDTLISEGDCPEINYLNDDFKYASAFCMPKYVGDFSTMGMNTEKMMKRLEEKGVFDNYDPVNNPNPPIKKDNENFIAKCDVEYANRGAELGYPDPAIEANYSPGDTGSVVGDALLGVTPVIGGAIDTINNITKAMNVTRILGSYYTEDTEENHLCERYMLDQELGVAMGVYEKNQAVAYMEDYRKEHPLDNSMLGFIARRTGQTKEQARAVLAQMNALIFIANYEPEGLGPLFYQEPKVELTIESTENFTHVIGIIHINSFVSDKKNQKITA